MVAVTQEVRPLTRDELLDNARSLLPLLEANAIEGERQRRLPDEVMSALFDKGLMRTLVPKRWGGLEAGWPTHLEVARILASAMPSAAWITGVVGAHASIIGRLPLVMQERIFAKGPNQLFASASAAAKGAVIRKVDGGYVANGVWRFASGVDHASWLIFNGEITDQAGEKTENNMRVVIPMDQVEIVDNWFVAGMKATGSKDVRLTDVFIPDDMATDGSGSFSANPPGAEVNPDDYIYDVGFGPYFSSGLVAPVLGAAEGAYNAYVASTKVRIGAMTTNVPAQMHTVQERLAESFCELDAARTLYKKHIETAHVLGLQRKNMPVEQFIEHGRERCYIARLCYTSVERLARQMGALGIYDNNPVQRFFRDISVMQTQVGLNWDVHMLNFGRRQLGLPTGMERLDHPPAERTPWGATHGKAINLN